MSGKSAKANRRLVLSQIELTFENGETTHIDISKVQLVDRETGKPLFNEVMDSKPEVEVVQDGHWTGVRYNNKEKKQ